MLSSLCSKHEIGKFIFISTCSNYGLIKSNDAADEEFPLNPYHYMQNQRLAQKNIYYH